jgi:cell division transport system permease protein
MALKRKTNYFYSILSVALVLFLLGFFGTALLFVKQQTASQQDEITMLVEIKEGADSAALETLHLELPTADFVKAKSCKFVPKEEAAEMMRQSLGNELINSDMPLPFYDAFSISLKSDRLKTDSIKAISERLLENKAVNDVYMDEGLIGEVSKTIEKIAFFAFALAFVFVIVAMTLIHNTIRLNLYSDRFTIKNMELVGASWGFITKPYIRKGVWNGVISALLALAMIGGMWFFIQKSYPDFNILLKSPLFLGGALGLILLGVLISWVSTYYVVKKHLRMRLDDLY